MRFNQRQIGATTGRIESPQLHQLAKQNHGCARAGTHGPCARLLKKGAETTHLLPNENVMQSVRPRENSYIVHNLTDWACVGGVKVTMP